MFSRSVTVRKAVRGYILVFCPVAALNEMQMIILDHSVTAAALEFSKRDGVRDNVNQLNTALFLDLVLRNISTHKELAYRAEELNWPRPPLAMICMDICSFKKAIAGLSEQEILEKKRLVSECLRTYMPQSVVVSQSDSFVCIFPEYAQSKEVLSTINASCSQIKELTGFSFTTSVINHILDYLDLADAYTEVRSMVDIARIIGKSGQIFFAGDLIKEQAYRHCVDNPYIRSYYQDTLEILRRYDAENDAILSIDTTKGNRIINTRGFAISQTVKQGYILRASEDLLDIMQRTTGKLPYVFPVNMQDITPYGNDVHHINSIMQPCTCTEAPVVGVAITTEMMVPGCGTGCSHMEDIEEAARFVLEVAKDFTAGKISFYDAKDDARMNKLYGSMKHLQQLGNRD